MIPSNDNERPPGPGFAITILLIALLGWAAGFYGIALLLDWKF